MVLLRILVAAAAATTLACTAPPRAGPAAPPPASAPPSGSLPAVPAVEIRWRGPLGFREGEPRHMYTLLTRGGFRAPTSPEFDSLVAAWLGAHPRAEARVVHVLQPMRVDDSLSQARAVWVVDGAANLNLELVRAGAAPGGTMKMPPFGKQLVTQAEYEAFARRVDEAEGEAQRARRGIWATR